MKIDNIKRCFEKNKKEIMKAIHKPNAFGQTESQIDFFEDSIQIHTHLSPCYTSGDSKPEFSITITHDPFISYEILDEIFEYQLLQEEEHRFLENEYTRLMG